MTDTLAADALTVGTSSTHKTIVLAGFPNCGKTTLFNFMTGLNGKTVNYPGSTVEYSTGAVKGCSDITLIDTPGIISLQPGSADEEVSVDILKSLSADLVVLVLNATQLDRQLGLVLQMKEINANLAVVVLMDDIAAKNGVQVQYDQLGIELDLPLIAGVATDKSSATQLSKWITSISGACLDRHINWTIAPSRSQEQVDQIVARCVSEVSRSDGWDWDRILLNPWTGGVIFSVIMTVFFWSIFSLAAPLMDAMDGGMGALITWTKAYLPASLWTQVLTDGILAGIGAVVVFVPQIAILFLGLGILERSGYLARGAVLIDRPLSAIGLNGRSFVPLLSGCACAIPAMMAARTIPGKKERLLTLFVIPLMTCSARLPVYGLLLALLIPAKSAWVGGLAMTGIYFGSIAIASVTAAVAGKLLRIPPTPGFQLELPGWKSIDVLQVARDAISQTYRFVSKAGPTILGISLAIWVLSTFPSDDQSWMMAIGKWMAPVFEPMGVDWRVGVALLVSFAAREVFVSALAVMFMVPENAPTESLQTLLQPATFEQSSQLLFTPASIVSLILFFMIAMQCLATVAIARKEMGGWKLPLIQTVSYLVLAYGLAVGAYQLLTLFY